MCICLWTKNIVRRYSYEVGEPYQVYDSPKKFYFEKNGEVLSVKPWKKYVVIQKLDASALKLISKKEYSDFPDNYVVEGMVETQNKYFMFYSSWSGRKTKHERLYVREIDFEKGGFIGEPRKVIDVDGRLTGVTAMSSSVNVFSFGGLGIVDKFDIYPSKDESKILVKYRRKPKVKNDKKVLTL